MLEKIVLHVFHLTENGVIGVTNTDQQTANIVQFYDSLQSTSYGVFDSGYKYTFDRFNNTFRYIPLNGDIAGIMLRTSINSFPWFSLLVQLEEQSTMLLNLHTTNLKHKEIRFILRELTRYLLSCSVSSCSVTELSRELCFDRINVRRLFLTIEGTIERIHRSQLFEFNDELTRSNFLNIVEPYLRDVKAKRGISDFVVICDETNNTPDVIDSNTFKADIFVSLHVLLTSLV